MHRQIQRTDHPVAQAFTSLGPSETIRDLLLITLGVGFLVFISLGDRDLWNPNEPIYGRAVVEMAERDDWLIPTVNGQVFAEKPILYYWMALATSELTGSVDEFSLRVPAAMAALASALLTYLLVLPYAGRRRALLVVALFATLYQAFWASRAVQMDILVLASTLGVVLALTRLLDFHAPTTPAFAMAGLAAGLGFLAKGPVSLVLPGLVVFGYAASSRCLDKLLHRHLWVGVVTAIAVCMPWYGLLWLRGEGDFLYEVLFRQNFTRFVDAWDHQQPWWYFLKYLWIDYAPWSWLLPAAWLTVARHDGEQRLDRLSWIWILGVIGFFSLSESKRAPYILPIAPAVAILASSVFERWIGGWKGEKRAQSLARFALATLAIALLIVGGALFVHREIPDSLQSTAWLLGSLLVITGGAAGWGVVAHAKWPKMAPISMLVGVALLYLVAAVRIFPAMDPFKSARSFSAEMTRVLDTTDGAVASFLFWDWRSGYSYYGERSIPGLETPEELQAFWQEQTGAHVLVEDENRIELLNLIPEAQLILQGKIGSRQAFLFAKPTVLSDSTHPSP